MLGHFGGQNGGDKCHIKAGTHDFHIDVCHNNRRCSEAVSSLASGLWADSLPWFDSPLVWGVSRLRNTDKVQHQYTQRPGHLGQMALEQKKISMSATTALLGTNFLFPTLNLTSTIDKKGHAEGFKKTAFFVRNLCGFFWGAFVIILGFLEPSWAMLERHLWVVRSHVGPVLVVLSFCCSIFCLSTVFHTAFC